MHIFVNHFGETKLLQISSDSSVDSITQDVKKLFNTGSEPITLLSHSKQLDPTKLTQNQTIDVVLGLSGGKKKKKKKVKKEYKPRHKHKNVKLRALAYYIVKDDGTVERVKQFCPQQNCKSRGIFMANHKDRYYCGRCHITHRKKNENEQKA